MQFCNFMNQSTWKAAILVSFALAQQTLSPARRVIFQSYMLLLASVNHEYKAVITLRLRLSMAVSMAELEKCLKVSKNELLGALKLCLRVPHKTSEKVLLLIAVTWIKMTHVCVLLLTVFTGESDDDLGLFQGDVHNWLLSIPGQLVFSPYYTSHIQVSDSFSS